MPIASALAFKLSFQAHLEKTTHWVDMNVMGKLVVNTQSSTAKSSSRSGQFLGQTSDGVRIARPPFKPEGFTVRELQKAVRALRKTDTDTKLG